MISVFHGRGSRDRTCDLSSPRRARYPCAIPRSRKTRVLRIDALLRLKVFSRARPLEGSSSLPFAVRTGPRPDCAIPRWTITIDACEPDASGQVRFAKVVGVTRFERATSCTQNRRPTRLGYTPLQLRRALPCTGARRGQTPPASTGPSPWRRVLRRDVRDQPVGKSGRKWSE